VVWIFIGVSLVAGIICLVLMIRRPRRRREVPPRPPSAVRPVVPSFPLGAGAAPDPERPADAPGAGTGDRPAAPAVRRLPAAVAAIAVGLFTALNLPTENLYPALGLLVGGALYGSLRFRRGRWGWLLGLAGAASLGLAAAYIVGRQWRRGIGSQFGWPGLYERVHILGLLAVFFLAADAVRELVTDHAFRRSPDDDPDRVPAAD
jgi:hypothetical protein